MKTQISLIFSLCMLAATVPAWAQKEVRQQLREGNRQYADSAFLDAEISYRRALELNPRDSIAKFNLGNTLYQQQKYDDAKAAYADVAAMAAQAGNKAMASDAYFNAGYASLDKQDFAQAEELFKQALRMNPKDDEARYNMILARKLKQQQEQNNKDQNKDKDKDKQDQNKDQNKDQDKQDQNKDQNKDKQDQNKDQKDQNKDQNNDQQDQNKDQNKQNQQSQSQQQPQMSKEQVEAILNASQQDEKDVQDKVRAKLMEQVKTKKTDKDW